MEQVTPDGAKSQAIDSDVSRWVTLCDMPSRPARAPRPLTLEIAAILRAARARQRVTTEELAEATGISRAQVGKQLGGAKPINLDELDLICHALGLNVVEVLAEADRALGRPQLEMAGVSP